MLRRILREAPFRLLAKAFVRAVPVSPRTKCDWDAVSRPPYLLGLIAAADEAIVEGVGAISVVEFGVAAGGGLVALQEYAAAVESMSGVKIRVFGFDSGSGLPLLCGDHRDHPDEWRPGDYPMDETALRRRLAARTSLFLGQVSDTIVQFVPETVSHPVGFVSVDLDLYSSSRAALQMFNLPGRRMLRHVPMYFDDVDLMFCHRFAGELLAIEEFNAGSPTVKIDRWRGVAANRAFPESPWLQKMYIAHDLDAIAKVSLTREAGRLRI